MKILLSLLSLFALIGSSFAASPSARGRTLKELNVIPTSVLERSISPWFYKSLLVSPIEGWVVVRAQLVGAKLYGEKVIQSDLDGAYDSLALERASEMRIAGDFKVGSLARSSTVLVHLLIYRVADGTMALSFANLDGPGGNQMEYFGCSTLAVLKNDGRWVEIKGPEGLQGKGLVLRARGLGNSFEAVCKLEKVIGLAGGMGGAR